MPTAEPSPRPSVGDQPTARFGPAGMLRLVVGGMLMGLANLVPGISGGTMLVAAGVYRRFIDAVSDASRLRLSRSTILTLGAIAASAGLAIALGAHPVAYGLGRARWAMYALFIGLTLGGVPALVSLVRPLTPARVALVAAGVLGMLAVVFVQGAQVGADGPARGGWPMLVLAGAAGASAMVLPGISGAYLLLVLGQYDKVVQAIKGLAGLDGSALGVLVPVGAGVVLGVVLVSNALRWLLHRCEKATMAVLLGLLLAAPAGLYPFRRAPEAARPVAVADAQGSGEHDPAPGPRGAGDAGGAVGAGGAADAGVVATEPYVPSIGQLLGSAALIVVGAGLTLGVSRLGRGGAGEGRG
ncbi:MAG: hypothetical protein KatS3mg103_1335 [Phycisphaerales bacterium]|nr:MAG: hypothetical protein KatS3mg103_1335 [Phycisphaerales bacterium]